MTEAFVPIKMQIFPREQHMKPYHPRAQHFSVVLLFSVMIFFYLYEISHAQVHSFYRVLKLITSTKMHIIGVLFSLPFLQ